MIMDRSLVHATAISVLGFKNRDTTLLAKDKVKKDGARLGFGGVIGGRQQTEMLSVCGAMCLHE